MDFVVQTLNGNRVFYFTSGDVMALQPYCYDDDDDDDDDDVYLFSI